MSNYREIWRQGVWSNNPGLIQLLGLCPLLAVSNTLINAIGLGLATLLTLLLTNAGVSLIRRWLQPEVRIAILVLIIAGAVSLLDLLMAAYRYELHQRLGIFVPLIVTNCAILARAESFASRQPLAPAVWDGLAQGCGFFVVLTVLGAIRELLGYGTLLRQADSLFGAVASNWTITIGDAGWSFLLAILPPGAFILLGLLLAAHRWISQSYSQPVRVSTPPQSANHPASP
ncbi:MAG: electron transport complex subunit E [Wenzhouxiangellaceae bacterium]